MLVVPGKADKKEKTGGKSKLILILVVLVVFAGAGAGWFFFVKNAPDETPMPAYNDNPTNNQKPNGADVKVDKLEMKDMVVNLTGDSSNRYIRLSLVLEYPKEQKKLVEEIKEKEHQIKDTLVTSLRVKTSSDVNNVDGLKESLLTDVNKNLRYGRFTGVYFTDLLVQ